MRRKTDTLVEALTGSFGEHHAFLARTMLARIDACTATENRLSDHIDQQIAPFHRRVELLVTIPGVSTRAAEVILAEIGADITRFPPRPATWPRGRGLPRQPRVRRQIAHRKDPAR